VVWWGSLGISSGLADDFGVDVSVQVPWLTVLGVIGGCLALAIVDECAAARSAMHGTAVASDASH
jgi:hypothetical protein